MTDTRTLNAQKVADLSMEIIAFNPLQSNEDKPEAIMDFLVQIAGDSVSADVRAEAREVLVRMIHTGVKLSMLSVVEAYEQAPNLGTFAASLRKATLPGPFGKFFEYDEFYRSSRTQQGK
jgi:hypothetical protein